MGEQHVLTVRGLYNNIPQVCNFVVEGAEVSGLGEGAIFHVELACDEACTNIIEHAYQGEGVGDIEVSWRVNGDSFVITFRDYGRSFDPTQVPPPAINDLSTADPENLRVGGLGIHFMRTLMDDIQYHFDQKKGNTLTMIKQIGGG